MSHLQPHYRGVRRCGALIADRKASAAARKKAIVALARRLAVDLRRMATGRVEAKELGLRSKITLSGKDRLKVLLRSTLGRHRTDAQ